LARRLAFLIGNQTFTSSSGLRPLQGPANDVAALHRILGDPQRGHFEVRTFLNMPRYEVLPSLEQALGETTIGDFVLIYYSGHGKLDRGGRLCLATADTRQSALIALARHAYRTARPHRRQRAVRFRRRLALGDATPAAARAIASGAARKRGRRRYALPRRRTGAGGQG